MSASEGSRADIRSERGAMAVTIGVLFGVLLAMGAFVFDWGMLLHERRQLQNGADAAVLAVAEDCAYEECVDPGYDPSSVAQALIDPNAEDGASALGDLAIDFAARTVTAVGTTLDGDGGRLVPFAFGRLITDDEGTEVEARAVAEWGALDTGPAVPLAISKCEWDRVVGDPAHLPSAQTSLTFHMGNNSEPCNGPAGSDLPGGFGWLQSSGCVAEYRIDGDGVWVGSDPGNDVPRSCSPGDFPLGTPLLVPIFDTKTGQGQGGQFHLVGFAAFTFHGYKLHSGDPAWQQGVQACDLDSKGNGAGGGQGNGPGGGQDDGNQGGGDVCITGIFTTLVELDAVVGDGTSDFGVRAVQLVE